MSFVGGLVRKTRVGPFGVVEGEVARDAGARHRDVREVHRPHLIRPRDRAAAPQIGKHGMRAVPLATARLRRDRGDAHAPHERREVPASDAHPRAMQEALQHPCTRKRGIEIKRVDTLHQRQVRIADEAWHVVHAATAQPQRGGLLRDRECVGLIDHRVALSHPALVRAGSKKTTL